MEEHRDAREEAGYQLMMEVFTRSMDDPPPPSRGWKGLGIVLVVLGGGVGLLLAIGTRPHDTPNARRSQAATARGPASPLPAQGFQEGTHLHVPAAVSPEGPLLPETPAEVSRPAVIPPAVDTQAGLGPSGISASRTAPARSKASRARPSLMSKRVAREPSIPRSPRSLLEEFDPNAELVRSTP
jgi:hypothetical protein